MKVEEIKSEIFIRFEKTIHSGVDYFNNFLTKNHEGEFAMVHSGKQSKSIRKTYSMAFSVKV